jgi:hypothetical protein
MQAKQFLLFCAVFMAAGLLGCAPQAAQSLPTPTLPGKLVEYTTAIPSPTVNLVKAPTATLAPTSTPAPRTHVLTNSDTLTYLAWFYHVSVDAILTLNPGLDRNLLSPGKTILIPPAPAGDNTGSQTTQNTPVSVVTGTLTCYPTMEGGVWCFWLVTNEQKTAIEQVTATITLTDRETNKQQSQQAEAPLDRLLPGQSLPLMAYFPSTISADYQFSGQITSALPSSDQRYLTAKLAVDESQIAPDERSASVQGKVTLDAGSASASQVWVAVVAYAADGSVVGARRWTVPQPLAAGNEQPFTITVYAAGGQISKVETFVEAHP